VIRITDRTLSCIDKLYPDKASAVELLNYLIKMDPGAIELSEKMYNFLSPLPEYTYILRIKQADDAKKYPEIKEFVCRNAWKDSNDERIRAEIQLNSTQKIPAKTIARFGNYTKMRIQGLDYVMCGSYIRAFECLKEMFNCNSIEFAPQNRLHCATALAAEWIISTEGNEVATSFGGINGFAPTEEVIMILRENHLRNEEKTYEFFPQMARLYRSITKKNVRPNKPVTGRRIFHVESGVHVDGILKQPKCYEPFAPEIVGQKRKIVLGKHSGTASIQAKLSEYNIDCASERIPFILEQVKTKAMEKNGAVSDKEFVEMLTESNA